MVFFGEYRARLDAQGRLVIPARQRQLLCASHSSVFIVKGLDACLFLFPAEVWESQSDRLKSLPFTKGDPRAFTRLFFSGAHQAELDRQGRVLIPAHLLKYAGIRDRVVIVGVGTRMEVWDEKRWDSYAAQSLASYTELAEKLMEM
mgnify:CR=1 FL=1